MMRRGNTMTVAWWKDDWMVFGKEGKLDVPGTVKNLKRAEAVLSAVNRLWRIHKKDLLADRRTMSHRCAPYSERDSTGLSRPFADP